VLQRCTTISEPPSDWTRDLLAGIKDKPKEPAA